MTTTPLDLDAIEARANAATDGPWGFYIGSNGNTGSLAAGLQMTSPSSYTRTRDIAEFDADTYYRGQDDDLDDDDAEEQAQAQMAADVTFVAAARTDVPDLVAVVRRLRAQLAAACEQLRDTTVSLETLHDQLVFENPDAADALQAITDRLNRTA
jgi:hypothetical protein